MKKKMKRKRTHTHKSFMAESDEWFRIRSLNQNMRELAGNIILRANAVDEALARRGVEMDYEYKEEKKK